MTSVVTLFEAFLTYDASRIHFTVFTLPSHVCELELLGTQAVTLSSFVLKVLEPWHKVESSKQHGHKDWDVVSFVCTLQTLYNSAAEQFWVLVSRLDS